MGNGRKHGLQLAKDRIAAIIQSRALGNGGELPSLAGLASETGVSRGTVWKALQEMRTEGVITGVRGHPFRVTARHSGPPSADQRADAQAPLQTTAWRRVRQRLQKDIVDGVFPPGTGLPSNKELQKRYGICFRTLQKALTDLEGEGAIEWRRKGFVVPALAASGWKPRIVCMARSLDESAMVLASSHDEAFMRTFEAHCRLGGIEVDACLAVYEPDTGGFHLKDTRTGRVTEIRDFASRTDDSVLGFVLLAPWDMGTLVPVVAQTVKPLKKPLVVLDGTGAATGIEDLDPVRFRAYAPTLSSEPAEVVGRHLLSLGYRDVAFISVHHGFLWSMRRLEGLRSAFREAGYAGCVHSFTDPGELKPAVTAPPYDTSPMHRAYNAWKQVVPESYRTDLDDLMGGFDGTVHSAEARRRLYSLFDRACADRNLRAWVTVNDFAGVRALQYLAEQKIRVPDDIAVISFDNFTEALKSNLTSYDFNLPAVATAALGFILERTPFRDGTKIEGFVASRLSTGRGAP